MAPRYRVEEGRSCIDIRLRESRQLFDLRDPAPFRERDLDADALEYLLGAVAEIPAKEPLRVVLLFTDEPEPRIAPNVLREAMRGHFGYQTEQLDRQLRQHLRTGQVFLLVGLAVLATFLTLAQLTTNLPPGGATEVLREGLTITGWVAMWRPLEVLLYDWFPIVRLRGRVRRLLAADIDVRYGRTA